MKNCSKCGLPKPIDEFHFRNKKTGTRHAHCKACKGVYNNTYLEKHSDDKIRKCAVCKFPKDIEDFPVRNKAKGTRQRFCKECSNKYRGPWYQKHRKEQMVRGKKSQKQRRLSHREKIIEAKKKPCVDCGHQFHWFLMEFDHTQDNKLGKGVSWLAGRVSMKKVLAEIDKCELVCVLCHRIRTWNRAHPENQITSGHEQTEGAVSMTAPSSHAVPHLAEPNLYPAAPGLA